jgi:hypothetical protein
MGGKIRDLTGAVFEKLTVLGPAPASRNPRTGYIKSRWYVQCSCGSPIKSVLAGDLKSGNTTSCGCQIKKCIDLTGQQFGECLVLRRAENSQDNKAMWVVQCSCGSPEKVIRASNLKIGHPTCGQCNFEDLTGREFGRFIVVGLAKKDRTIHGVSRILWECLCLCGNTRYIIGSALRNGNSRSCGCLHKEIMLSLKTTHGDTGSREHQTWCRIRSRCFNENSVDYYLYGGRGIRVCEGYSDYSNFRESLGPRPSAHSIDRIDVNGHYSCGECIECIIRSWKKNCRWATTTEQARNRRNNVWLSHNGETKTIVDWSPIVGISTRTLAARKRHGWSDERALTEPIRRDHSNVNESRVYFVEAVGFDSVKIGFSRNLSKRLDGLMYELIRVDTDAVKPSGKDTIYLLGTIAGNFRKETELHERFDQHHLVGEWFRLSAIRNEIQALITAATEGRSGQTLRASVVEEPLPEARHELLPGLPEEGFEVTADELVTLEAVAAAALP